MFRQSVAAVILLAAVASAANADVLYLANGGRVEGVVRLEGETYVIEMLNGTARIKVADVVQRQRIPYVTEVYEERRGAMNPSDPDAHLRLSLWCRAKGLTARAEEHLERVLELDPDHAEARARRGEVKVEGVWMSRADASDLHMAKAGFLRFEGRWFTEAGLSAYLEAKRELLELEALAAARRAERAAEERAGREEEERIAKLAAERAAIEAALKRAEEDRLARDALIRENQRLADRLREAEDAWRYGYGNASWWPSGWIAGPRSAGYRSTNLASTCRGRSAGPSLRFSWTRGNFRVRGVVR